MILTYLVPDYQGEITTEKVKGKLLLLSIIWPTITDGSNLFVADEPLGLSGSEL